MTGAATPLRCRACGGGDIRTILDLGALPLANRLPLTSKEPEERFPLVVAVCRDCRLVQLDHGIPPETIFADYPYFSSCSTSWVEHARHFAHTAAQRLALGPSSLVVEIASNDGYLLRHFQAIGVPVLGIEPSTTVAAAARAIGIPTDGRYFGAGTARSLREAGPPPDLVVANNVLAHVPDLDDFLSGLALLLENSGGVLSCEFPHLLRLIKGVQFDTIYHEHFSYFSLLSLERAMKRHGLVVFDLEELPTHGGSLRLWVRHSATTGTETAPRSDGLARIHAAEAAAGLDRDEIYDNFAATVRRCITDLRGFLDVAAANGQRVAAYGAAAKGATLLGACGVTARDIVFVADINPHKQGRSLPGTGIPIVSPDRIFAEKPDRILILPWNLREEIMDQLSGIRAWGGRFVVPIPHVAELV
ncbi:class I SAM-dependent methyltransferase [Azospirillum cavernae]|uniref:Class I SAM-dependent methyltransferase n=2 Tax=Azospirillum cavernae TaxID=2320860 RepID=A0A418VL71_9PROT|nr:class I SAM-dependent methyltransferase [Azospirillum cavernae]